jgi:hypothetical protein
MSTSDPSLPPAHPHPAPHTPEMHESPDTWHDHAADERPQHAHLESINAPKVTFVGLALFLAVVATVVIVYGFYIWSDVRMLDERESFGNGLEGPALAIRDDLKGRLTQGFAWANHDAAVLPLDQGVEKVVQQYSKQRADSTPAHTP